MVDPLRTDNRSRARRQSYDVAIVTFPVLFAFDEHGAVDPSFGANGVVDFERTFGPGVMVEADDAGGAWVLHRGFVHVLADGAVDPRYRSRTDLIEPATFGREPDHRAVFAGSASLPGAPGRGGFSLQASLADGSPDPELEPEEIVKIDLGPTYGEYPTGAQALSLAPAGRVTVAGAACERPYVCDVAVVRYGAGG
jgi:hypothetical protein